LNIRRSRLLDLLLRAMQKVKENIALTVDEDRTAVKKQRGAQIRAAEIECP
jgi:hypothetical protein